MLSLSSPCRRVEICDAEGDKVTVVVTGANGALGRRLTASLLADGSYNVHCLDLWIPDEDKRLCGVCSYIQTDVCSEEDLVLALQGVDAVFHTAGLIPMVTFSDADYYRVNTDGTANVLAACRESGVKRLVYTSSVSVIFSSDPAQVLKYVSEADYAIPDKPFDAYSGSKGAAEKLVLSANNKDGLVTCALRLGGLYDAGSPFMTELVQPSRNVIIGDGKYLVAISFADSAAEVHIIAEKKLRDRNSIAAGKAYFINTSETVTHYDIDTMPILQAPPLSLRYWQVSLLAHFNKLVYQLTGRPPISRYFAPIHVPYMVKHIDVSPALAKRELGWEDRRPFLEKLGEIMAEVKASLEEKKTK